jgi:ATPase subunit of ABC transporter with duplicated ATPase domains
MLTRLYVDNYRCFVNFQLDFQELTLLVGPNGAGKSSVLDLLAALRQLLSGVGKVNDPGLFPWQSLTRWQDRNLQEADDVTYRLEIEHDKEGRRARIILESLAAGQQPVFEFRNGEVQLYRDDHLKGPTYGSDWTESALARVVARPPNRRLSGFLEIIRGMSVCALDPKRFQAEAVSEEPQLQVDGANFSAWYRHQIQERQDLVIHLVENLRKFIDDFHSIRIEKVGSEARAFIVVFGTGGKRYELRLDELSDGQRALIALYAFVYLAGERDILVLDEPDNYLALAEIQPWLMALSDTCGTKLRQAVICSHHPELIDYFGSEVGVFLKREKSGGITARRLSEMGLDASLKLSEIVARGWES